MYDEATVAAATAWMTAHGFAAQPTVRAAPLGRAAERGRQAGAQDRLRRVPTYAASSARSPPPTAAKLPRPACSTSRPPGAARLAGAHGLPVTGVAAPSTWQKLWQGLR